MVNFPYYWPEKEKEKGREEKEKEGERKGKEKEKEEKGIEKGRGRFINHRDRLKLCSYSHLETRVLSGGNTLLTSLP
jgi:hypothetical protein